MPTSRIFGAWNRSERSRRKEDHLSDGSSARIAAVDSIPKALDTAAFNDAFWKMFGRNQQQNTDSEGFTLGATIRMAMRMDEIASSPAAPTESRSFARTFARGGWTTARMQALGVLKLDDDQIDRLFGLDALKKLKAKP